MVSVLHEYNTHFPPLLPIETHKSPLWDYRPRNVGGTIHWYGVFIPKTHLLLGIRIRLRILFNFHTVLFAFENWLAWYASENSTWKYTKEVMFVTHSSIHTFHCPVPVTQQEILCILKLTNKVISGFDSLSTTPRRHMGGGGVTPSILELYIRLKWVIRFTLRPLYPTG